MTAPSRRHSRLPLLVLAALVLFTSAAVFARDAATPKPRLVVLLVVDGLPQRQVADYRDQLAPDGLRRFLDRGAWFTNAHYGYGYAVTATGHAALLTGAYPDRSGIIGNEWLDPATGEREYCTADAAASYIGHATRKRDGTSPKNLKVDTVGDVLRRLDPRSKVVAISIKDRGAILPAGKRGVAYMYQAQTGQFASSTYYMKDHPRWVKDFNAAKPADAYFGAEWKPLLAEEAYARSVPDGQKWYAAGGTLPKRIGAGMGAPGPLFYGALIASPFSDALTFDFARAALAGEALGQDDAPDILAMSLSGHDYVNHAYSAESRISHDHVLHVDRALQAFFRDLDATVGKDAYVAVLTSDHGFTPAPELSRALGRDAGRLDPRPLFAKVDSALARRFGEGKWVAGYSAGGLLLDRRLVAQRGADADEIAEEARKVLLTEPAIAAVFTRAELESGSRKGAPLFDAMRKSWNRELSADVQIALKPYWMLSGGGVGATHGSPHADDTHVPLLFYGPAWISPARIDARVEIVDIAPTLAAILGVPPPAASEGRVLALKGPPR
jgi:predicted AlkP superfamily pyrophosphatase or phosphodiesterase